MDASETGYKWPPCPRKVEVLVASTTSELRSLILCILILDCLRAISMSCEADEWISHELGSLDSAAGSSCVGENWSIPPWASTQEQLHGAHRTLHLNLAVG